MYKLLIVATAALSLGTCGKNQSEPPDFKNSVINGVNFIGISFVDMQCSVDFHAKNLLRPVEK